MALYKLLTYLLTYYGILIHPVDDTVSSQ